MRKSVVFASVAIAFLCQLALMAKDAPKVEFFGGYQYKHLPDVNLVKGWNASVVGNVSDTVGVVADIGGSYKTIEALEVSVDTTVHTFLFGPRFHSRQDGYTGFVHILAGYSRYSGAVDVSEFSGVSVDVGASINAFTMALGGGFDVNVGEKIAFRVFHADWMVSRSSDVTENGLRLSFGINFLIP